MIDHRFRRDRLATKKPTPTPIPRLSKCTMFDVVENTPLRSKAPGSELSCAGPITPKRIMDVSLPERNHGMEAKHGYGSITIVESGPWREDHRWLGHYEGRNGSWVREVNATCVRVRFEADVIPIKLPRLPWWRRLASSRLPLAKVVSKRGVATE